MSKYSAWLKDNYPAAVEVTAGSGIFPETLLAQAIIESAKNSKMPGSELSRLHNNYFGIKAGSKKYKGATVNFKTGEFNTAGDYYKEPADFRKYKTPADSFKDYVKFLQGKRYAKARAASTIQAQAAALQAAGYSTAPNYAETIAALAQTIKSAAGSLVSTVKKAPGKSAAGFLIAAAAVGFYLSRKN